jgi:MFS family permease
VRSHRHALLTLGVALFFTAAAFHLYAAALPLYFASLGFDPTLIGLLVGAATGLTEFVAVLLVGPAIDRFGGRLLLVLGAGCYLAASLGYLWLTAIPALAALRMLQGLGIAAVMPASYSFVPGLVQPRRETVTFASLGAAANVAMAVCPPIGLALMDGYGPRALFATAAAVSLLGMATASRMPAPRPSRRPFRLTFRRAWLPPLLIGILTVIQWGAIATFLPLVAQPLGSNPGLLFTADAVAILVSRIPAGWLADRYGPLRLVLLGLAVTIVSDVLLLLPPTDGILVASGALNGLGGGLILPPMLAQLSRRSDEKTRGSAFAYFSTCFALGFVIGSGVGGLLYPLLGFHGLLIAGAALCGVGMVIALGDRALRESALTTHQLSGAPGNRPADPSQPQAKRSATSSG